MRKVTAIQGEIVEPQGQGLQVNLREQLAVIAPPSVLSAFVSGRGFEIRGVVDGWADVPALVRRLRCGCRPLKIRIGLGIGQVSDEELRRSTWAMRGEPFLRARAALREIKVVRAPVTFVQSGSAWLDDLANCIWALVDAVQNDWTDKQWEAINAYERANGYVKAAESLEISFQGVQRRCRAARWNQVRRAEKMLTAIYEIPDRFTPEWARAATSLPSG